jgi:hypothetical protein
MSMYVVVPAAWVVLSILIAAGLVGVLRVSKQADREAARLLAEEVALGREGVVRELPVATSPRAPV